MMIGKNGGLSTLCSVPLLQVCMSVKTKVLKTFPSPGHQFSEDGVIRVLFIGKFVYIYIYMQS